MNLEEEIQLAFKSEATVNKWRNDFNSDEYKRASELNDLLFGKPFNKQRNCGCINDFFLLLKHRYSNKENINLKIKQMDNKFKLKEGVLVQSHAIGDPVNNNNLTDAIAIKLLQSNKGNINLFQTYPENWEVLVNRKVVEKEVETEKVTGLTLRETANNLADTKEIKRPHWKSSDDKLKKFISENS